FLTSETELSRRWSPWRSTQPSAIIKRSAFADRRHRIIRNLPISSSNAASTRYRSIRTRSFKRRSTFSRPKKRSRPERLPQRFDIACLRIAVALGNGQELSQKLFGFSHNFG